MRNSHPDEVLELWRSHQWFTQLPHHEILPFDVFWCHFIHVLCKEKEMMNRVKQLAGLALFWFRKYEVCNYQMQTVNTSCNTTVMLSDSSKTNRRSMCTIGNYSKYTAYMAENAIHIHMYRRGVPMQHIQNKLYTCQPPTSTYYPHPGLSTPFTKQDVCNWHKQRRKSTCIPWCDYWSHLTDVEVCWLWPPGHHQFLPPQHTSGTHSGHTPCCIQQKQPDKTWYFTPSQPVKPDELLQDIKYQEPTAVMHHAVYSRLNQINL